MKISYEEAEQIYTALSMRRCWIETKNISLSAEDLRNQGREKEILRLNDSQREAVSKIKSLMDRMLHEGMTLGNKHG